MIRKKETHKRSNIADHPICFLIFPIKLNSRDEEERLYLSGKTNYHIWELLDEWTTLFCRPASQSIILDANEVALADDRKQ